MKLFYTRVSLLKALYLGSLEADFAKNLTEKVGSSPILFFFNELRFTVML